MIVRRVRYGAPGPNAGKPLLLMTTFMDHPMKAQPTRALAVPFLGVLASLQLIDPSVANTVLVKAAQAFEMQGASVALGAPTTESSRMDCGDPAEGTCFLVAFANLVKS